MIIALDFDGTVVKHAYPNIGEDIGAVPVLYDLLNNGARFILWTIRGGRQLTSAREWFFNNNIPLWGINQNPDDWEWVSSNKARADLYIDDAAAGAPLIYPENQSIGTPYIDWIELRKWLVRNRFIREYI